MTRRSALLAILLLAACDASPPRPARSVPPEAARAPGAASAEPAPVADEAEGAGRGQQSPSPVVDIGPDAFINSLSSRSGGVVLVNAWALWCVPCRAEFPDLLSARDRFADRGFSLMLLAFDDASQHEATAAFLADRGVDFTTWRADGTSDAFAARLGGGWDGGLPATWIFDRQGRLRAFWQGRTSVDALHRRIEAAMAPPDGDDMERE